MSYSGQSGPRGGMYGDGAPLSQRGTVTATNPFGVDFEYDPDRRKAKAGRVKFPAGRLIQFEGLRGLSTLATVRLRYFSYFATIMVVTGSVHWMHSSTRWHTAGLWMLLSSALMVATAAAGTMIYTNQRNEIIEQMLNFVFGYAIFPGLGFAVLMRAADGFFGTAGAQNDPFTFMLGGALPILYFITVLMPPLVFIKTIAGLRNLHRSNLDNEEYMRLYTRQDDLSR